MQDWRLKTLKRDPSTGSFLWILQNLGTPILKKHLWTTASVNSRSAIFQESLILPFNLYTLTSRIFLVAHAFSFDSCATLENSIYYVGFLVPEAVAQICFVKKVFVEISQNSQKNTCAKFFFLIKFSKKKLWHRCFTVSFAQFLRASFFYGTPPMAASVVHLCCFHPCNLDEFV